MKRIVISIIIMAVILIAGCGTPPQAVSPEIVPASEPAVVQEVPEETPVVPEPVQKTSDFSEPTSYAYTVDGLEVEVILWPSKGALKKKKHPYDESPIPSISPVDVDSRVVRVLPFTINVKGGDGKEEIFASVSIGLSSNRAVTAQMSQYPDSIQAMPFLTPFPGVKGVMKEVSRSGYILIIDHLTEDWGLISSKEGDHPVKIRFAGGKTSSSEMDCMRSFVIIAGEGEEFLFYPIDENGSEDSMEVIFGRYKIKWR